MVLRKRWSAYNILDWIYLNILSYWYILSCMIAITAFVPWCAVIHQSSQISVHRGWFSFLVMIPVGECSVCVTEWDPIPSLLKILLLHYIIICFGKELFLGNELKIQDWDKCWQLHYKWYYNVSIQIHITISWTDYPTSIYLRQLILSTWFQCFWKKCFQRRFPRHPKNYSVMFHLKITLLYFSLGQ